MQLERFGSKNFEQDLLNIVVIGFNLKDGPVKCAKVCNSSEVILNYSTLILVFIPFSMLETLAS